MPVVQPQASGAGIIRRYHSGHITPPIPDVGTAVALAQKTAVTVGQPGRYGTNGSFADDMVAANPALLMFPYQKGVQYQGGGGDFPDRWYSHRLDGTKLFFSTFNVYIMESTGYSVAKTFGGVSGTNWRTWHTAKVKAELDAANAAVAGDPWCGFWLDSLGPRFSYAVGPPAKPGASPARNYTLDEWQLQMLSNPDLFRADYPGLPTWANGFNTDPYGQQLVSHVDGIWREGWLRGATAPATTFPTTAAWSTDLQQLMTAQASIPVAVTVKLWATHTIPQRTQWRLFTLASYLIADRGRLYYEFLPDHLGPWVSGGELDQAVYDINLGPPIDAHPAIGGFLKPDGVHYRRFTNGVAIVNTTAAAISVPLDRAYQTISGVAITSPLLVPAHSGRIAITVGAIPPQIANPPLVVITTPANGATIATKTTTLSATVTAAAGIGSVSWRILGSTDWAPLASLGGSSYGQTVTLNGTPGSNVLNTISVRCIDADGQSTSTVAEVTVALPFRKRRRR